MTPKDTPDDDATPDEAVANSYSELATILEDDANEDVEPEQPSEDELAELDMPELRARYGPFVDLDINEK